MADLSYVAPFENSVLVTADTVVTGPPGLFLLFLMTSYLPSIASLPVGRDAAVCCVAAAVAVGGAVCGAAGRGTGTRETGNGGIGEGKNRAD